MTRPVVLACAVAAAAVSGGWTNTANAQDGLQLEEIIVTARKRSESVQDVPLSIIPFQAEELERRDLKDMEDLATGTLGLTYSSGTSSGVQGSATLRGLATNFITDRFQNVGMYLDGVYLQRQSMINIGMIDLARVEVVKGPQNALYGRNAFAGAINYVTQTPTEEMTGYLMTTQGSDDREDYRAMLSGPIVKDQLFGRIAFGVSEYDGANENTSPFADVGVPGDNNDGNLGGWDDQTMIASLLFTPNSDLEVGLTWYDTEIRRENQANYTKNGLQEIAVFDTVAFDDLNYNTKTIELAARSGAPGYQVQANTLWKGELPYQASQGTFVSARPWSVPYEDQLIPGAVDHRGFGAAADTEILSLVMDWDISDSWSLKYQFSDVDHDSKTGGPAARDPLAGSTYYDFLQTLYVSTFSARPNSSLETWSHELRLDWEAGDDWQTSFGLYYGETDDEQDDLTIFAPPCSDRDLNGDGSNADELAYCNVQVVPGMPSPLDDALYLGNNIFFNEYWNGQPSNYSQFHDEIIAIFSEVTYNFSDTLTGRLEMRYTREDREVERLADLFGLAYQEVGVGDGLIFDFPWVSDIQVPEDDETFDYFTPRISLDWALTDNSMIYGYLAKGVKSGGFNNTSAVDQLTYDEEENWTLELGSKNVLFDNRLILNGAVFYVDWKDVQGSQAPSTSSQNSNVVIGNIGDATNIGFEIEGTWRFNESWSIDLGYTWINPEYDDADYDAAQRYFYYGCEQDVIMQGELCGDTNVDGNQLPRTSEEQAIAAINYVDEWFDGWTLRARIDGAYQSKQYLTALNVGYIGSRTLYNGQVSATSPDEHWDLMVWSKNLTDEEYLTSWFTQALFNSFLVAQGQERSWGVSIKYNL